MANEAIAKVGKDCKLYYAADIDASPTYVLITQAINVSLPTISKTMVEVMSRETNWKSKESGLKEISLSFGYLYRNGSDSVFDALRDSFLADTKLYFAVMDGPIATVGSEGFRFPGVVSGMSMTEELEGVRTFEFTVDLVRVLNSGTLIEPDWLTVAAP
jgi:hypothetical protein